MDYEDLSKELRRADRYCLNDYSRMAGDAAAALTALLAENEKLRADLERLGLELEVRKRQEEAMTDIANDFQRQLHTALEELEQVKHQRDSYRM